MKITADIVQKACRSRHLPGVECFRLVDGEGDQTPSLFIDKFGQTALAHFHDERALHQTSSSLKEVPWADFGVSSVYLRHHQKSSAATASRDAELIYGEEVTGYTVREHKVTYLVDPKGQVNAGFFLDMREVRKHLLNGSNGKSVLNLFLLHRVFGTRGTLRRCCSGHAS